MALQVVPWDVVAFNPFDPDPPNIVGDLQTLLTDGSDDTYVDLLTPGLNFDSLTASIDAAKFSQATGMEIRARAKVLTSTSPFTVQARLSWGFYLSEEEGDLAYEVGDTWDLIDLTSTFSTTYIINETELSEPGGYEDELLYLDPPELTPPVVWSAIKEQGLNLAYLFTSLGPGGGDRKIRLYEFSVWVEQRIPPAQRLCQRADGRGIEPTPRTYPDSRSRSPRRPTGFL